MSTSRYLYKVSLLSPQVSSASVTVRDDEASRVRIPDTKSSVMPGQDCSARSKALRSSSIDSVRGIGRPIRWYSSRYWSRSCKRGKEFITAFQNLKYSPTFCYQTYVLLPFRLFTLTIHFLRVTTIWDDEERMNRLIAADENMSEYNNGLTLSKMGLTIRSKLAEFCGRVFVMTCWLAGACGLGGWRKKKKNLPYDQCPNNAF